MKRLLTLLLILAMVSGCSAKPLAKLTEEAINIDITEDFDPASVLTDVQEGTDVSYELDEENSHLVITLTKDDKTETLETDVTITYPRFELPENITIDTYTGYDINGLVETEDGVEISSELNEETGELTITYTKGNYSQTITQEVEVVNSDPWEGVFPGSFKLIREQNSGTGETWDMTGNCSVTFYADGTLRSEAFGQTYNRTYTITNKTDEKIEGYYVQTEYNKTTYFTVYPDGKYVALAGVAMNGHNVYMYNY